MCNQEFFWSLTLYTLPDRFLYANEINRYSLGDRSKDLHYGADGSLTLYVSHAPPAAGMRTNWLPAPRVAMPSSLASMAPARRP